MSIVQVLRKETPPLSFREGYIKLASSPESAIFDELLREVAVRRVRGNSTLYSVTYRRPKKKTGKKRSDVSSPLIVTVYHSDFSANKFRVLVKMLVNVRLPEDASESYRFGVSVAVDEVAECVYVAYTRDEPTRSVSQRRLFLRRVQLTLAAADARGVRRLQRPSAGRPPSVIFEAKNYSSQAVACIPFCAPRTRRPETRLSVQQLLLDGATLLLYVNVGFGSYRRGSFKLEGVAPATAQLTLNKKKASIDVHIRRAIWGAVRGAGQHKFLLQTVVKGPLDGSASDRTTVGELTQTPTLLKLGSVADAGCQFLTSAARSELGQQLAGDQPVDSWVPIGSIGRWLMFCCCSVNESVTIVAVHGLGVVARQKIVSVHAADVGAPLQAWDSRHPSICRPIDTPLFQVVGRWLLITTTQSDMRSPSSERSIILRANLRSLLLPSTLCVACHLKLSTGSKKMCKVCHIRGFGKYSWAFGCHFCSAACLRDAWPTHSLLHKTPPLRKWTDADWQKWRSH